MREEMSAKEDEYANKMAEQKQMIDKLTQQRARDKNDIEVLKASKKEQSLKSAKQAKESLMKQKSVEQSLKSAKTKVSQLESQLVASQTELEKQKIQHEKAMLDLQEQNKSKE